MLYAFKDMSQLAVIYRFNAKVNKSPRCWLWEGKRLKRPNGDLSYGRFSLKGKRMMAHRASWLLFRGAIPKGKSVLHKCDNTACVRPSHLFLGTQLDNMRDCLAKGRYSRTYKPFGKLNPMCKITVDDVHAIRALHGAFTLDELAMHFPIGRAEIGLIQQHKHWGHV